LAAAAPDARQAAPALRTALVRAADRGALVVGEQTLSDFRRHAGDAAAEARLAEAGDLAASFAEGRRGAAVVARGSVAAALAAQHAARQRIASLGAAAQTGNHRRIGDAVAAAILIDEDATLFQLGARLLTQLDGGGRL